MKDNCVLQVLALDLITAGIVLPTSLLCTQAVLEDQLKNLTIQKYLLSTGIGDTQAINLLNEELTCKLYATAAIITLMSISLVNMIYSAEHLCNSR